MERRDKVNYYLDLAEVVSQRGPVCASNMER